MFASIISRFFPSTRDSTILNDPSLGDPALGDPDTPAPADSPAAPYLKTSAPEMLGSASETMSSDSKINCPHCHQQEYCRHPATPLLDDGLCCDTCFPYVRLCADPLFLKDVKIIISVLPQLVSDKIQTIGNGFGQFLAFPDLPILPEKSFPLYACGINAFYRTAITYKNKPTITFKASLIKPSVLTPKFASEFAGTFTSLLSAAFYAEPFTRSSQETFLPTFWLRKNGTIEAAVNLEWCDDRLSAIYRQKFVQSDQYESGYYGRFELVELINEDTPSIPHYFSCGKNGRAKFLHYKNGNPSVRIVDSVVEAKKAAAPKETKEEKKQRQREEQRQLDRQRREEESALRAARSTLVTAVAKIDADLERIKHLKELNREVALKNRKIFERKEAEKLAAAAAARHADKLKQKEAERIKFITKKN